MGYKSTRAYSTNSKYWWQSRREIRSAKVITITSVDHITNCCISAMRNSRVLNTHTHTRIHGCMRVLDWGRVLLRQLWRLCRLGGVSTKCQSSHSFPVCACRTRELHNGSRSSLQNGRINSTNAPCLRAYVRYTN